MSDSQAALQARLNSLREAIATLKAHESQEQPSPPLQLLLNKERKTLRALEAEQQRGE